MTSISIQIPLSPLSLNDTHRLVRFGGRASRIKTESFIRWEKDFLLYLLKYKTEKDFLIQSYNEKTHGIMLEVFLYINESKYFALPKTKKDTKRISKKSKDTSNCIKPAEDQIFRWLGIDDSQVTKIIAEKIPTNDQCTMVFRISLIKFPELFVVCVESI